MSVWYVRDRGRVVGPLSREQVLEMKDRGQIQGYHEVSHDKRAWRALDLEPELNDAPRAPDLRQPRPPRAAPTPGGQGRSFRVVVGAAVALLVVCVGVGAWLLTRGGRGGGSGGGPAPAGCITFRGQTASERGKVLAEAVGLVVAGAHLTWPDGSWLESNEFGTGSGFSVTPDGHLITNRHVVEELVNFRGAPVHRELERRLGITLEPRVWVFFGREGKFEAEVSYVSPDYDMAVLKIVRTGGPYFALCVTDDPLIPMLDAVASLGFPGSDRKAAQALNPSKKITTPRGSPIQREFQDTDFNLTKENGGVKKAALRAQPDAKNREAYYLAHTARIRGGNSGGPLVAADGTVLGINTLGLTRRIRLPGMAEELKIDQEGQNFALTMPQLRKEIEKHAPGVVWRAHPD